MNSYQVLVVGDATVGKTTALRKLAHRPRVSKVVPTVAL
jgi:GTPase SAR1 family protein